MSIFTKTNFSIDQQNASFFLGLQYQTKFDRIFIYQDIFHQQVPSLFICFIFSKIINQLTVTDYSKFEFLHEFRNTQIMKLRERSLHKS